MCSPIVLYEQLYKSILYFQQRWRDQSQDPDIIFTETFTGMCLSRDLVLFVNISRARS